MSARSPRPSPALVAASISLVIVVSCSPSGSAVQAGPAPAEAAAENGKGLWTTDVQAAMKTAAAEKKDLLLDFTGSDWCSWCVRLKREVFDQADFQAQAPSSFVLVELDFPQDKSRLSEATQKQNQEWLEKFGVQGFPTIILTDSSGRPYAQTGYQPGGAKKYLAHLDEQRKVREKRDAALASAETAKGAEKAKHLAAALEAVGEALALSAYRPLIEELIAADAKDETGQRSKYEDKLQAAEARKLLGRIDREFNGQNLDEMMKLLAETEAKYGKSAKVRAEIGSYRIGLLQSQGKDDEAAKIIEDLLKTEDLEPLTRVELSMRKAGMLRNQGKTDEVVAILDSLIANAAVSGEIKLQLRAQRAQTLAEQGKVDDGVKALDELIADPQAAQFKVVLWVIRSEMLSEAGRKEDAIASLEKAIAAADDPLQKEELKGRLEDLKSGGKEEGSEEGDDPDREGEDGEG